jgi:hypothetical protein
MSAIDDIISGIEGLGEKVTEASEAASAVLQETEQALETAESLGATGTVQILSQVKDQLEALIGQISSISSAVDEAQTTAKSMTDGT